ncbi:MAG: hypothetical protein CVV30_12045 [Methanomicrobiales archaeon HGW-Methanomicrobiales-1]|jgi:hypothetical protein|nr:MAG: hypothetical protein CVV30_12045 [Methanomicrobiales archaeon HGW-Methanomicrobiales-1]
MKRKGVRINTREEGISEVIDEILIIALCIGCAVVILIVAYGGLPLTQKTAYVVSQSDVKSVAGQKVITLFNRGGDPVSFSDTPLANYKATVYVDTPAGSFAAVPAPGTNVFTPGDLVYLYYTGSGFILANDLAGASIVTLPAGQISVRLVDATSGVLISQEIVIKETVTATANIYVNVTATVNVTNTTATPTATSSPIVTATVNVTAVPTANVTATATSTATSSPTVTATVNVTAVPTANVTVTATTSVTPTATATTSTRTITVRWSPTGSGYGSLSPPVKLTNGQEISVPRGSSKTIYFVPNAAVAVLTIKLDGTIVYTGSSKGITISYTVTNVVEDRQLTATFG